VRAAVVGAGVYGCTTAVELARAGHRVDLYERHQGLLLGATRTSCYRLHSGYHYPRSPETALAARADAVRFAARFPTAVVRAGRSYYAVARAGSRTSAADYLAHCERLGSGHVVVHPPHLLATDVAVLVDEAHIDIGWLRAQLRGELRAAGVTVHLGAPVYADGLDHDLVVVATYGRGFPAVLQWEVCEVALVEVGAHYAGHSYVIMDGDFVSFDPVPGQPGLHALYDVANSVHATNTGMAPQIPDHLAPLLDRGQIPTEHTHVDAMWATARRFLAHLGMVRYHGSLFTVRAVLPGVDATDTRPTLIRRDGRVLHVLAGKIDGAPAAAGRVVALAGELVPA